ncbi:MAG: hypothetical protein R3F11_31185 [Verrucomicrobiales bacterium]
MRGGDAAGYDRGRALFNPDVLAWVQAAHSGAWEALEKNYGGSAGEVLLDRLATRSRSGMAETSE